MTSTQMFYSLDMNKYRFRFIVHSDHTISPFYDKVGIELIVPSPHSTFAVYNSQSVSVEVDGNTQIYAFSPNTGFRLVSISNARAIWCELVRNGWSRSCQVGIVE